MKAKSQKQRCLALRCQPTLPAAGRSFSMLTKLLAKDRNFLPKNVKHNYMCVHHNLSFN